MTLGTARRPFGFPSGDLMIISPDELSRIDKLLLDRDAADPLESRRRRAERGLAIAAGNDVAKSYNLQLALMTAVNLAMRAFAGKCTVYLSHEVSQAPNKVRAAAGVTIEEALLGLGAQLMQGETPAQGALYLLLGSGPEDTRALRLTFDGWRMAVGPARDLPRMRERSWCPLAGIAVAAVGVGEAFADFARIAVAATRRIVTFSLWRPQTRPDDETGIGQPISEVPGDIAVFGLGHLGQAYLWAYAALAHENPAQVIVQLCDDDEVEKANLETGAIATERWLTKLKTRMAAQWLEDRGFRTRLLERRIDQHFRRATGEPVVALSGFDDNRPRQWLARAGYTAMFDSGLGGEATNFDSIAFHAWPNPRAVEDIWHLETGAQVAAREARRRAMIQASGYGGLDADECGRLILAGKSVSVPFVGALAACIVLSELLKAVNGGPTHQAIRVQACSIVVAGPHATLAADGAAPIRGLPTQRLVDFDDAARPPSDHA